MILTLQASKECPPISNHSVTT